MPQQPGDRTHCDQKQDCPGGEQKAKETEQQSHELPNLAAATGSRGLCSQILQV
jgi:hypothetical protein